ncbi:uncharacterized protein LOC135929030 [Gordionus sp. m RMFG-2023]|uniref:uncharacterized protein LOC135929030 n=1 Tax=Gordionus sp. m RMFG-2023 TaxID=3053472 RepID=UPI0031FE2717
MAEFILSSQNNQLLIFESFIFQREKLINDTSYWRCVKFHLEECNGRARTKSGVIFHNQMHNHVPDIAEIEARKEINQIKEKATTSQTLPNNIIADITTNISTAAMGRMPSCSLIKRTIQRKRRLVGRAPTVPVNLIELIIPIEYQINNNGQQFLLYDSGHHDHRCLIFSTVKNIQFLSTCDKWYADGTFKTCPPLFQQIYTIHGMKYDTIIPAVYILMASRRHQNYLNIFEKIKNFEIHLDPRSIMTDFELAAISAFNQSFPLADNRGYVIITGICASG